jgi:hypothetical protein
VIIDKEFVAASQHVMSDMANILYLIHKLGVYNTVHEVSGKSAFIKYYGLDPIIRQGLTAAIDEYVMFVHSSR